MCFIMIFCFVFVANFKPETVSTQYLCELLSDCKAKYSVLGVHLGLHPDKISAIEKGCGPGDVVLCLQHAMDLYLREKQPNMEELCRALVAVDRRGLSEKLREKYHGMYTCTDSFAHRQ